MRLASSKLSQVTRLGSSGRAIAQPPRPPKSTRTVKESIGCPFQDSSDLSVGPSADTNGAGYARAGGRVVPCPDIDGDARRLTCQF
jgi:hypothetical protein